MKSKRTEKYLVAILFAITVIMYQMATVDTRKLDIRPQIESSDAGTATLIDTTVKAGTAAHQ